MNFDLNDAFMGLAGGLMIGVAAAILLLGNGRIAGISGVFGATLRLAGDRAGNVAFLAGLIGVPAIYGVLRAPPAIGVTTEPVLLVTGGLLVGLGTRLGGGCTSGHGVCGMSRFSRRSLTATATFMAVAALTASVIAPVLGVG